MGRSYQLGIIATAVVVAAVVLLLLPVFGRTATKSTQTKNLSNAKQLATACKIYASDHEGRFPVHLSELEPDYVPSGAVSGLRYVTSGRDGDPKHEMDWLYFGAGFDEKNPPRLLIASPQATTTGKKQHRVIMEGDTSGRVIIEADYIPLLNETIQQMQKLHPARPTPADSGEEKTAAQH